MKALEKKVKRWMTLNADQYDTATALVESANTAFDNIDRWVTDDTHEIWDWAADLIPSD